MEIHISPACPHCWAGNLRREQVFFWLNFVWSALLSDRPVWFYCPVFGVPAGVLSKASHVSKSISVSTSPISLWPQPAVLTVLFGQHNASASAHVWRSEPWGHPGRMPCTFQITQWRPAFAHMNTHIKPLWKICEYWRAYMPIPINLQ